MSLLCLHASHSPGQDDIEDAARDSALLAEELAAMLDRLEGGEGEEDRRAKSLVEEELGQFPQSDLLNSSDFYYLSRAGS